MRQMMINSRYVFVAIVCFCATTAVAETPDRKQPNVVFLLADDLGWTGLGALGAISTRRRTWIAWPRKE